MQWTQIFASRMGGMKASEIRELLKLLDSPEIISFAGGIPDPALFPREAYAEATMQALDETHAQQALQYSVSEGYLPLRNWLADYMGARGVPCEPEHILITSGSQQALDYLGKLFISEQDKVATEHPTYMGALGAFKAYQPRFAAFDPMSNTQQASALEGAKFIYVTPDFANPTGTSLTEDARRATLGQAEGTGAALIEDGAYEALWFDQPSPAPILALDCAENGGIENTRTIYCGSFSKTLAPGLRIGWVCAASPVIEKLVLIKQASDLHTPSLNQIVTYLVAREGFEAHLRNVRAAYATRRDAMLAALKAHMPQGVEFTQPNGGMFVWVTLPKGQNATELLPRAIREAQVAYVPGGAFYPSDPQHNTLRLSFSCASPERIEEGIGRLSKILS